MNIFKAVKHHLEAKTIESVANRLEEEFPDNCGKVRELRVQARSATLGGYAIA